eukprot:509623-Rhodomonas_salina.4
MKVQILQYPGAARFSSTRCWADSAVPGREVAHRKRRARLVLLHPHQSPIAQSPIIQSPIDQSPNTQSPIGGGPGHECAGLHVHGVEGLVPPHALGQHRTARRA